MGARSVGQNYILHDFLPSLFLASPNICNRVARAKLIVDLARGLCVGGIFYEKFLYILFRLLANHRPILQVVQTRGNCVCV